jgi:hypothetical protein
VQIDRSFRVRKLNLHFPFPAHKTSAQTPPVLDKTLLDGEMVIDHVDNVVRPHSLEALHPGPYLADHGCGGGGGGAVYFELLGV